MSTVLPSTTRKLAALAATKHVTYLACPVLGRPPAAAAGQLLGALSGGTESVRERAKRIIHIFAGKGVLDLGDDVGAAHALKLTGNFYIAGQIELASEALALAEKSGVDQGAALKVMETIATGGYVCSCVVKACFSNIVRCVLFLCTHLHSVFPVYSFLMHCVIYCAFQQPNNRVSSRYQY